MSDESDLEALGVYDSSSARADAFARVLVLGPAKAGKTTAIATTAPRPLVINCDGDGAAAGAAARVEEGADGFLVTDAVNRRRWAAAIAAAEKLVREERISTVVVDTVTLLSMHLVDECSATLTGFDIWNEVRHQLVGGCRRLMQLPAHVFIIAHMMPSFEDDAGILPMIAGKSSREIPALVNDCVLLDLKPGRQPHERMFLVGAQEKWSFSGRNVRRSCAVEATVPALLAELGIPL